MKCTDVEADESIRIAEDLYIYIGSDSEDDVNDDDGFFDISPIEVDLLPDVDEEHRQRLLNSALYVCSALSL